MQGLAGLQFTKPTTLGNPNWRCQSSRETCTGTMHWSYKHCPTCCWRGSEGGAFHMLWRENLSPPKGLFASKEKKSADKWQILEICASTGRCNLNLRHSGLLLVSFPVLLRNFVLVSVTIKKIGVFLRGHLDSRWMAVLFNKECLSGAGKMKKMRPKRHLFWKCGLSKNTAKSVFLSDWLWNLEVWIEENASIHSAFLCSCFTANTAVSKLWTEKCVNSDVLFTFCIWCYKNILIISVFLACRGAKTLSNAWVFGATRGKNSETCGK